LVDEGQQVLLVAFWAVKYAPVGVALVQGSETGLQVIAQLDGQRVQVAGVLAVEFAFAHCVP
jgi:hypothetical protein